MIWGLLKKEEKRMWVHIDKAFNLFFYALSRLCNSKANRSFDPNHWDCLVKRHHKEIKFHNNSQYMGRRESSHMTAHFQSK